MGRGLESVLGGLDPRGVTEAFLWLLGGLLFLALFGRRKGQLPTLTAHAPVVLATVGILGTFVGIVVGLLGFDPAQLDESIQGLLQGLKTAFISSVAGLSASLLFRLFAPLPFIVPRDGGAAEAEVGPEDVVAVLTEQKDLLQATRDAIAGGEESSLAGQLKLLRGDLGDRQRAFETKLWEHLDKFAESLSRSATEQVIEALKEVIVDFNRNLTEQFGDNFKKLDESVRKLVEWQENYRRQIEQLHRLYDQSVRQIAAIEESVARVAERSESIPATMERLTEVVKAASAEIEELERHLAAFAELRDRAVEAVPQAQAHVQSMTEDIGAAVRVAGEHVTKMQQDSTDQLARSRELLEGLAQAGDTVRGDILMVQDSVTSAIEQMQSRVETALKEALDQQARATETLVQRTLEETGQVVSRAGESITRQLEALDEAQVGEMERVRQLQSRMDTALKEALDQQTQATETLVQRTLEETGQVVSRAGESITRQLEALDEAQVGEMERVRQLQSRMGLSRFLLNFGWRLVCVDEC